jgi:hypothetical protein
MLQNVENPRHPLLRQRIVVRGLLLRRRHMPAIVTNPGAPCVRGRVPIQARRWLEWGSCEGAPFLPSVGRSGAVALSPAVALVFNFETCETLKPA